MCELLNRGLIYRFYVALKSAKILFSSFSRAGSCNWPFKAVQTATLVESLDLVFFVEVFCRGQAGQLDAEFSLQVHHLI